MIFDLAIVHNAEGPHGKCAESGDFGGDGEKAEAFRRRVFQAAEVFRDGNLSS